ncbi:MAG: type II secretion system major pseudopilin GspG [Rubripirellula sp.]
MLCRKNRAVSSRSSHAGFSLVELIVVMVILGMLAGLVAMNTRGTLFKSKQQVAISELATLTNAMEIYYANTGRYPTANEGLEVLAEDSDDFPGGILKKLPSDPWKNPYEYLIPGTNEPFEIICLGADGREGGDGENKDISSESLGEDE